MKTVAAIYLLLFGVAAVVSVIWPAEDTYISPVVERSVETRVERVVADPVNLSQQIEVNVKEVASLETRVTEIERSSARLDVVERQATNAFSNADSLRLRMDAAEDVAVKEAANRKAADLALFVFTALAAVVACACAGYLLLQRKLCQKTQPTSGAAPTKRL